MLRFVISLGLIGLVGCQAIGDGVSPGAGFDYYTPDTYPNSLKDYKTCGLSQPGFVCDPNGLLGVGIPNRADGLDILVRQILAETNCSCVDKNYCNLDGRGFTVSVAILKHIHTDGSDTELDAAIRSRLMSNFGNALRNKQNRGQCDDDILIVLSSSEASIYTAMSNTTSEHYLHPEDVADINNEAYDSFKDGKFVVATAKLLNGYKEALKGTRKSSDGKSHWYSPLPTWAVYAIAAGLFLLLVVVIVLVVVFLRLRSRRREYTPARTTDDRYGVERL
uniref:Secreted protein n=1 Tax=Panagrellus redivivus TaxID=6233 RepID=A0A7E4W3Z0_PANRE